MTNNRNIILCKIEKVFNNIIRPFLREDGGDLSIEDLSKDMILTIKFLGLCKDCPINGTTLEIGIKSILKKEIPEIKDIKKII
ncbi:MAG: NifU family protein [Bacteroides sp.]|nr:MAG: NifU family protein [Bacteroides sp.]